MYTLRKDNMETQKGAFIDYCLLERTLLSGSMFSWQKIVLSKP